MRKMGPPQYQRDIYGRLSCMSQTASGKRQGGYFQSSYAPSQYMSSDKHFNVAPSNGKVNLVTEHFLIPCQRPPRWASIGTDSTVVPGELSIVFVLLYEAV